MKYLSHFLTFVKEAFPSSFISKSKSLLSLDFCCPQSSLSNISYTVCDSIHWGQNCENNCTCVAANTQTCDPVNGTCTCKTGWTGRTCADDVNECLVSPNICGDILKTCQNTPGSYTCSCISGYTINNLGSCIGKQLTIRLHMLSNLFQSFGEQIELNIYIIIYRIVRILFRLRNNCSYFLPFNILCILIFSTYSYEIYLSGNVVTRICSDSFWWLFPQHCIFTTAESISRSNL